MAVDKQIVNEVIVSLFHRILDIQEKSLHRRGIAGLTMTEVHTIEAIGSGDLQKMSQVAAKLEVTVGTLTTGIDRLVKKGYVFRERSEEDRRIVFVGLTDKGRTVERIHRQFHEDLIEHMMVSLRLDEDEVLLRSLQKIKDFFEEEYGENIE
ncbi:MAG: MarR family transcriptional regulator [Lachnospiraceae bacterium]|nr:MarR family transcriptional regulator [Lachnospiraceae bacterium]MDY5743015.1 MarR family transcriptional regulator [Lachnospiraceae bacterium]